MDIRITIISFIVSITSHAVILAVPGILPFSLKEDSKNIEIKIEIPYVLPKIEKVGEEKKLIPIIEKPNIDLSKDIESKNDQKTPVEKNEEILLVEKDSDRNLNHNKDKDIQKSIKKEVTVSNSLQEEILRYQDKIKQKVQEARRYPAWAMKHRIEGEVEVRFVVRDDGVIGKVFLEKSSGFKILDGEAIATIKRADPFPEFPTHFNLRQMYVDVIIVFKL